MIVKDEEAVLGRCLDSVRPAVDEMIIVDTGSKDRTKEIAARYTDKVYDFVWADDFSAARNFSFSKANMDFILWLDADDVLLQEDCAALARLKQTLTDAVDVVMLPYHTAFDEEGKPVFSYYRERLIRRGLPHAWEGRVHEAVVHAGRVQYAQVPVTHRSVKTEYSDRNLKIYEKQEAGGEPLSPRDQFYYGRELYYHQRYDRAKERLRGFLSAGQGWVENNLEACKILAYCYLETGDVYGALDALSASFRYGVPRAETCCELGNAFMRLEDYRTAAFWFELARKLPRPEAGGAFVSEDCYGFLPCIQLCVCYDRLGEREKAAAYNRLAGAFRPAAPAYLHNLTYFEGIAPQG